MGATSNMQGLYTLLPSLRYEQLNGGGFFAMQEAKGNVRKLSVTETYKIAGLNMSMINNALQFHNRLNAFWDSSPFKETYLMNGRKKKSNTIVKIVNNTANRPKYLSGDGDGTVPSLSSDRINNKFLFIYDADHSELPKRTEILQKILSIIKNPQITK
jgi:hypothetical protein